MKAFIKSADGWVKVYDHGTEWEVFTSQGNEYWFSVWQEDKRDSLLNAIEKACKYDGISYDLVDIVVL